MSGQPLPISLSDADNDLFSVLQEMDYGDIHFRHDPKTGMRSIVAIHSTREHGSLGGCRCIPYDTTLDALSDVMRLAQAMSYKAAFLNIPFGGGKSVIIRPKTFNAREETFAAFGHFINGLNGRYTTAMDSGTTPDDMKTIARVSNYVSGLTKTVDSPAPFTAMGVFLGIQAAVKHKLGRDDLRGLHVAIQGIGNVGMALCKFIHEAGAKLTVTDINEEKCVEAARNFGATIVDESDIYSVACDVFAPCALGGSINAQTVPRIKAPIIAGAANNQLATQDIANMLRERDILYAPDYVINGGGLLFCAESYLGNSVDITNPKIQQIKHALTEIFEAADKTQQPTSVIADEHAKKRISNYKPS